MVLKQTEPDSPELEVFCSQPRCSTFRGSYDKRSAKSCVKLGSSEWYIRCSNQELCHEPTSTSALLSQLFQHEKALKPQHITTTRYQPALSTTSTSRATPALHRKVKPRASFFLTTTFTTHGKHNGHPPRILPVRNPPLQQRRSLSTTRAQHLLHRTVPQPPHYNTLPRHPRRLCRQLLRPTHRSVRSYPLAACKSRAVVDLAHDIILVADIVLRGCDTGACDSVEERLWGNGKGSGTMGRRAGSVLAKGVWKVRGISEIAPREARHGGWSRCYEQLAMRGRYTCWWDME